MFVYSVLEGISCSIMRLMGGGLCSIFLIYQALLIIDEIVLYLKENSPGQIRSWQKGLLGGIIS